MIDCPDCDGTLSYVVSDDRSDKDYTHIYEMCAHCGYVKAYVDYKDDDTGPINHSGLDY